jgi:tRNA (guanine-N7-)-methyltransferase
LSRRKVKKPVDYELRAEKFLIETSENNLLDLEEIFGNNNPVYLEIGSGNGFFLTEKARRHPDINFIGIELKPNRIYSIMKKLDFDIHTNVRLMNHYVDKEITQILPKESIAKIYIQHPDPWPKKRHHKNRLIRQEFIDALNLMLKHGANVEIATDHPDYSEWIIEHFDQRKDFEPLFEGGFTFERQEDHIETYFENVKESEGFPPRFMFYKKL